MGEGSKQVRVDNWGIFFLQRLQMFFSKTDYCDLTLQFEGNVQLKVHRLVMNACTEYFTYLEQTCPALEENTIIMPTDLQADVIVPIVNFMYTGMLEFHMSIFEKLYKAAEMMDITVLTKLLDAQKIPTQMSKPSKKKTEAPHSWNTQNKKTPVKTSSTPELPPTLPGRKLPVWKRKNAPMQHPSSQLHYTDQKWAQDPLLIPDNTPKPTRFEWPEEDLPPVNLMDTSFEDISYTSKPLLTQEEEIRASTSFDEVRNSVNSHGKRAIIKTSSGNINIKDVENFVKEQKIRAELPAFEEGEDDYNEFGQKRKLDLNAGKTSPKRLKISDKENKETTISIKSTNGAELDHTKIVSEILKKYPQLVKKNKNIRLKIMASGNKSIITDDKIHTPLKVPKMKVQEEATDKSKAVKITQKPKEPEKFNEEGPWSCDKCTEAGEVPQEFVLYYLYRKHMTDVHNEMFDLRLCKYCGRKCGKHNLMMYHLYTKHGLKPPASYNFPKCDQCPFIALSSQRLTQHKLRHNSNEMQCIDCKLAFTSQQTLTAHIQITGHFNKPGRSSYDCQYCTKKLQSAINLFSHIKNSHLKEARRDGIVSLDEMDDVDEMEQEQEERNEEEVEEEYIIPEMLPDVEMHKDKVKIISNVKVPGRAEQGAAESQQQAIPLEPSSEAEALSNVASGIATSLGLVDIVVLDENQQYILQQQETQGGQTEFILPELAPGENPFSGQVITTQHSAVLPQGMLQSTGSDIGSTDELVMVLTDHDYQDDQGGGTADNSNIVVLYSHPVDGQQGQFITSQGNLLVNSQTGMLEIRNGATIATTTANQIVNNSADTPIESIEMIQREIDSHGELKQEPSYEKDRKPNTAHIHQENGPSENVQNHPEQPQHQETAEDGEDDQENRSVTLEKNNEKIVEETRETTEENVVTEENLEVQNSEQEKEDEDENQDKVDGQVDSFEEPMETDEIEEESHKDEANKEQLISSPPPVPETASLQQDLERSPVPPPEEIKNTDEERGIDIPPETTNSTDTIPIYETSETLVINETTHLYEYHSAEHSQTENSTKENVGNADENDEAPEPMEVDGKTNEQQEQEERCPEENVKEIEKQTQKGDQDDQDDQEKEEGTESEEGHETTTAEPQIHQEEISQEVSEDTHQIEASNSHFNEDEEDENSQSSQDTTQSQENIQNNRNQSNINQTILDDWEDTDSQQSEKQRAAMKEAAENVNKLMDDWEEEEDDEEKKD